MDVTCPECHGTFIEREALCEDWRDPNRSFGCPHCASFFLKEQESNLRRSYIQAFTVGGVFTPSVMMTIYAAVNGYFEFLVYGGVILVSCLAACLVSAWGKGDPEPAYTLKKVESSQAATQPGKGAQTI